MSRPKSSAYAAFRALGLSDTPAAPRRPAQGDGDFAENRPAQEMMARARYPRLAPYQRCTCGACRECRDNRRWDRIFSKFESDARDVRGMFQSTLNDF